MRSGEARQVCVSEKTDRMGRTGELSNTGHAERTPNTCSGQYSTDPVQNTDNDGRKSFFQSLLSVVT